MKLNAWYLLPIKDSIEIICIIFGCYHWMRLLKQDKQKPLANYFIFYIFFWSFCFLANFSTLMHILDTTMPIVMILFIIMHEKNFISLYKKAQAKAFEGDWLKQLIRFCLQAEKDLLFLIEHQNTITDLIDISIRLQAPLDISLLNFITTSPSFAHTNYIYLNSQGMLLGLNVTWQKTLALDEIESNPLIKTSYLLQQTDTLTIHYSKTNRNFYLILEGTIYGPLTSQQILQSVEKYLKIRESKQGVSYAPSNQSYQAPAQQPHA